MAVQPTPLDLRMFAYGIQIPSATRGSAKRDLSIQETEMTKPQSASRRRFPFCIEAGPVKHCAGYVSAGSSLLRQAACIRLKCAERNWSSALFCDARRWAPVSAPLYGTCARPAKALESPPHDAFLLIQRLHRIPIMPPPPNADCLQNYLHLAVRRCGNKINWLLSLGIIIFGCLMLNAFATWPSQVDGPSHSFSQRPRRTLA